MVARMAVVNDSVPVIDIAGLSSSHLAERTRVATEIGRACREVGFLSVVNHGIDEAVIEQALDWSRRFFSLPMADKVSVRIADNRGYDPPGNQRLDSDALPDLKESWIGGADEEPDHPLVRAGHHWYGPNRWPAALPGFKEGIWPYYWAVRDLCERMLRAMALSLELPEDHFEPFHRWPIASLRLLHYPPRPAGTPEAMIGAGAHTDWGAVTALWQDDVGGLEVAAADGSWLPMPPIPGAFAINIGDLMARWTNDHYRSTPHRVIGDPMRERWSMALFFDLDADAAIECLPSCCGTGDPPRYAPTTAGRHLLDKYEASLRVA
jgi:isopenicillin N synthase-like dioxygenase